MADSEHAASGGHCQCAAGRRPVAAVPARLWRRPGSGWRALLLGAAAVAGASAQACAEEPTIVAQPGGTCVLSRACGLLSSAGDCSGVTSLSLRDKAITALQADVFAQMAALETLDLGWNEITALPGGVFSGLARLKTLHLFENKLSRLEDGAFAGLNLERLSLGGNTVRYMAPSVFQTLEAWLGSYPALLELPADHAAGHEGHTRTFHYYNTILL